MAKFDPRFATLSTPMPSDIELDEESRLDDMIRQSAAQREFALGRNAFDRYIGSFHGLPSDTGLLQQQMAAADKPIADYINEIKLARDARTQKALLAQQALENDAEAAKTESAAERFERQWKRDQDWRTEDQSASAASAAEKARQWEAEEERKRLEAESRIAARAKKGGGKGSAGKAAAAPVLTEAEIDAMDATPQQKSLLKASVKKGDEVRTSQIVNEVAKVEAEKGKAKVATESDYKKVLRLVEKLEKAEQKDGVPVGLDSRYAYADPNIGGNVGNAVAGVLRFSSNATSSPKEQENRRIYRTLIDTIRKEQFGASFTGGEKIPYQEMFGLEASAHPSVRVNALKDIKAKAQEDLGILKRQRRGSVASGKTAPASTAPAKSSKIRVRNQKTGETLDIDPSDEKAAAKDGFKRI